MFSPSWLWLEQWRLTDRTTSNGTGLFLSCLWLIQGVSSAGDVHTHRYTFTQTTVATHKNMNAHKQPSSSESRTPLRDSNLTVPQQEPGGRCPSLAFQPLDVTRPTHCQKTCMRETRRMKYKQVAREYSKRREKKHTTFSQCHWKSWCTWHIPTHKKRPGASDWNLSWLIIPLLRRKFKRNNFCLHTHTQSLKKGPWSLKTFQRFVRKLSLTVCRHHSSFNCNAHTP